MTKTAVAMMIRRRARTRSAIDGSRGSAELESTVMKSVIVIPARWASSRFPGKPLAMIAGISLIQRVYERAARSTRASAVFVATDDDRIADHVASFGGRFVRPEGEFQSGTDRIAASLDLLGENSDQVINVQGDEPLIDVESIDAVIEVLQETGVDMATLASRLEHDDERQSRDVDKVVAAHNGDALYFSRSPLAGPKRHVVMSGYQASILNTINALAL